DGIRDFHVTGVQTCALPISQRFFLGSLRHERLLSRPDGRVNHHPAGCDARVPVGPTSPPGGTRLTAPPPPAEHPRNLHTTRPAISPRSTRSENIAPDPPRTRATPRPGWDGGSPEVFLVVGLGGRELLRDQVH